MLRLIFVVLLAFSAYAQEFRGTILGRVIDPSGSPTAGTVVEAVNVDTGVKIGSVTNESGNYVTRRVSRTSSGVDPRTDRGAGDAGFHTRVGRIDGEDHGLGDDSCSRNRHCRFGNGH